MWSVDRPKIFYCSQAMALFEDLSPKAHLEFIQRLNEEKPGDIETFRQLFENNQYSTPVKDLPTSVRKVTSVCMALLSDA